uniref:Uncharacterized protein n=1 Tax=Vespula pensylvanica TaxID=30213 RepID=A0A834PCF9_VESPE|nr:hypothetical protein H0235_003584 [Vespula pensylvanica]
MSKSVGCRIWNGKLQWNRLERLTILNMALEVEDEKLEGRCGRRLCSNQNVTRREPGRSDYDEVAIAMKRFGIIFEFDFDGKGLIERRSDLCSAGFTQSTVSDSSNSIFHRMALGNAVTEYLADR